MQKAIKYTIFNTKWGYFGLAGTEYALCGTCLPLREPEKVESHLLKNLSLINRESSIEHPPQGVLRKESIGLWRVSNIEFDKTFFKTLQEQITSYFEGACVNFSPDIPLVLDGFSRFCGLVLTACRDIKFGQTISYSELAKKAGRPAASRAIGNTLARNPLPLIIPCHRVVRSDGKIGGFSAPGGISLKKKMLELERKATRI
ncbi:MAG: methylated-DNA--[protein]-cysteine S-methyltransferase [Planctomycetota bacterium]|jgi:methylated-DNA-[protein]-cysteine S-methyltransferase